MKKVAIVTLYHNNYNFGGQLQAYAMQKVISEYNLLCEVVDYIPNNKFTKIKNLSSKDFIIRFFSKLQMKIFLMKNPTLKTAFNEKLTLFRSFMNLIHHSREIKNEDIQSIAAMYDYWITGSDQVWTPSIFNGAPLYLLEGIDGKKISYAASSKNAIYSKSQMCTLKAALKSFSAISVREKGLEKTISCIAEKTVTTVLDPTLLLTHDEWDKIAVFPKIRDRYAFVYLIHHSDKVRKKIYSYCKKHKLKMIIVPHSQGWYKAADEKYYDVQATAIGPAEWIGYIKNADIIFTDSFHGTAFSVNYHKNFISFEDITGNQNKNNGLRKYSFLKLLGLLERCVPYTHDLNYSFVMNAIDYEQVELRLNLMRKESRKFLEDALDIKR